LQKKKGGEEDSKSNNRAVTTSVAEWIQRELKRSGLGGGGDGANTSAGGQGAQIKKESGAPDPVLKVVKRFGGVGAGGVGGL